jgi:ComF family protein
VKTAADHRPQARICQIQFSNLLNICPEIALTALRGLFPQDCVLCGDPGGTHLLCDACHASLPRPGACCERCAMPGPAGQVCGRCLRRPPHFDATTAALLYDFPADRLVHALKYRAQLPVAGYFAATLAQALEVAPDIDLVVAMPLHPRRLCVRGFNQAAEIGRRLAHRLRLPFSHTAIQRTRDTPPQTDLPVARRRANVRGAFSAAASLSGANIAVVDDVMTTGATADEVARVLKGAGAARVEHWVVARTWPGHQ